MQNREGSTSSSTDGSQEQDPEKGCSYAADVTALLDGELDIERADEVRRHLADCEPCWVQLRSEMQVSAVFSEAVERRRDRETYGMLGSMMGAALLGNFAGGAVGAMIGVLVVLLIFRARERRRKR